MVLKDESGERAFSYSESGEENTFIILKVRKACALVIQKWRRHASTI